MKNEEGKGFQVISVNPDSPAGRGGLGAGMIITAVDGEKIGSYTLDQVRTLIRSKMNTKFSLEISGQDSLAVDCTGLSSGSVTYRLEKPAPAISSFQILRPAAARRLWTRWKI